MGKWIDQNWRDVCLVILAIVFLFMAIQVLG